MARPVVSVVLPVRDAEATVERAVESLRRQTLREMEIVAVDDGSTDGTNFKLELLAEEEPRLRVVRTSAEGLVPALRRGVAESSGEFIARMDADDESLPRRLEASVAALRANPRLAAVGTQVEIFRDDRPVSPNMEVYARWLNSLTTPERVRRERFVESPLCHPSATIRRDALEAVGGWRAGDFPEDYELWLRLVHQGWELSCVPEVLFRWRDHDARLTRRDPRYAEERFTATRARYLAVGPLAGRRCAVWGAGRTGLSLMRLLRAEGVQVERFLEVDPAKIGTRIEEVPVASWTSLGPPGEGEHLLAAVGAKGAREEIRSALTARGWVEERDFTCCA